MMPFSTTLAHMLKQQNIKAHHAKLSLALRISTTRSKSGSAAAKKAEDWRVQVEGEKTARR